MRASSRSLGLNRRELRLVGVKDSDYSGFIIKEDKLECVRMIIDYIGSNTDYFKFDSIPEESATALALRKFSGQILNSKARAGEDCQYLPLSKSWQEYFSSLSLNFRKNLRKEKRNLERDFKVEFEVVTAPGQVSQSMQDLFDLHQKRWAYLRQAGLFSNENRRAFHLETASLFAENGWLRLFFLRLNGERAAASYCFSYEKKLYGYISGFDPRFSKYGVGSILTAYLIDNSINEGLREVDFLRGAEPYKESWNTMTRKTITFLGTRKGTVQTLKRWVFYLGQRINSTGKP